MGSLVLFMFPTVVPYTSSSVEHGRGNLVLARVAIASWLLLGSNRGIFDLGCVVIASTQLESGGSKMVVALDHSSSVWLHSRTRGCATTFFASKPSTCSPSKLAARDSAT